MGAIGTVALIYVIIKIIIETIVGAETGHKMISQEKENLGNGTYVKLEYQLYCEERDKYLKEHDEPLIYVLRYGYDTVHDKTWTMQCFRNAQKRLEARGYRPAIRPDICPAFRQAEDEYAINRLRLACEHSGTNMRLISLGVDLEEDRDPWKIETDPKKLNSLPQIYELPEYQRYVKSPILSADQTFN